MAHWPIRDLSSHEELPNQPSSIKKLPFSTETGVSCSSQSSTVDELFNERLRDLPECESVLAISALAGGVQKLTFCA